MIKVEKGTVDILSNDFKLIEDLTVWGVTISKLIKLNYDDLIRTAKKLAKEYNVSTESLKMMISNYFGMGGYCERALKTLAEIKEKETAEEKNKETNQKIETKK